MIPVGFFYGTFSFLRYRRWTILDAIEKQILSLVKSKNPGNPLAYVRNIVRPLSFERLTQCIKQCNDCPISNGPRSLPYGNYNGSILIIRDFVSKEHINDRYIYSYDNNNESDVFVRYVLESCDINMNQTLWINAVNCCPYETINKHMYPRMPNKTELNNCEIFSRFAIESFAPIFIFLMGSTALSMFVNENMNDIHGRFISLYGITTMPIYSPEYLRNAKEKMPDTYDIKEKIFKEDMRRASDYLRQTYPQVLSIHKEELHHGLE